MSFASYDKVPLSLRTNTIQFVTFAKISASVGAFVSASAHHPHESCSLICNMPLMVSHPSMLVTTISTVVVFEEFALALALAPLPRLCASFCASRRALLPPSPLPRRCKRFCASRRTFLPVHAVNQQTKTQYLHAGHSVARRT